MYISGALAQLGARLHGMEEATGSSPVCSIFVCFSRRYQLVRFEKNELIIEPIMKAAFWKNKKIAYKNIERIEATSESVLFYMKNSKVIKVDDPAIPSFYTKFGEMLRDYRIPFKTNISEVGYESIEKVREKAAFAKETALAYANRSIKDNLGPEYELTANIVERIIGTTLEFLLLKNGEVVKEANIDESIDEVDVVADMDIAFLNEWDPDTDSGLYFITEQAIEQNACEEYVKIVILDDLYEMNLKDKQ